MHFQDPHPAPSEYRFISIPDPVHRALQMPKWKGGSWLMIGDFLCFCWSGIYSPKDLTHDRTFCRKISSNLTLLRILLDSEAKPGFWGSPKDLHHLNQILSEYDVLGGMFHRKTDCITATCNRTPHRKRSSQLSWYYNARLASMRPAGMQDARRRDGTAPNFSRFTR